MLILGTRLNEVIVIEPIEGLDPNLTVAELFAAGPITLVPQRSPGAHHPDRLGIAAPDALAIRRQLRWRSLSVEDIGT